jgi:Protein of unknown function (DUF3631)
VDEKTRSKLVKLHAKLGTDNPNERQAAWLKIVEILRRHGKTWNDLAEILANLSMENDDSGAATDTENEPSSQNQGFSCLDLVCHVLNEYVELKPHEYVAVALWILHTHVFRRFMVTPRLAILSPVRGCGKTTLLSFIERLAFPVRRTDGISSASIYRLIDLERCTLLIDEVDNLDLARNGPLRAVLNSGHRKGGSITRVIEGAPRQFSTFAPIAIAAIGTLPLPTMHRSIVLSMERSDGTKQLRTLTDHDPALKEVYRRISLWAKANPPLDLNPAMPAELRNRTADNWRPLIAIANMFGPDWADKARQAALIFSPGFLDEDIGVVLLRDIRAVFETRRVDRLASATLVAALNEIEDGSWSEWRGVQDNQPPRCLSPGQLAQLLKPFSIKTKTVWPACRRPGDKSAKGYFREQFERAWKAYCPPAGTPAQRSSIKHLRSL